MRIKQGYNVREIVGENVVIMSGREGADMTRIITLNDSALLLWNSLCAKEFTIDDVARVLLDNYDVEPSQALTDAQKWVAKMQEAELLE
ncbi:MAG: PqqD family protein [Alistipes sp.]|nr:PqqD family protein [Alistipes sp.]MBR2399009.1 PqqD family protein [Alistipes sp.]MBR7096271.1 PqqD family protein [Alistipes sp.]